MTTPTTMHRDEVRARTEASWAALWRVIDSVPQARREEPGAVGEWSLKDLLGHLAFWDVYAMQTAQRIVNGVPDPDFDTQQANDAIQAERRAWSWEQAAQAARDAHAALLDALPSLPELLNAEELHALRDDCYEHYAGHADDITAWLARGRDADAVPAADAFRVSVTAGTSALEALLRHNAWANDCLFAACEGLSEAQLDAAVVGTFGSVRDTLRHIVGAQERYVIAISEATPLSVFREQRPFPGVAALRQAARVSSMALVDLATRLPHDTAATVTTTHRDERFTLPVWLVLLQIINHATEHRAQIATILTQQGVQPPGMDGWTYDEETADADWSRLWAW